MNPKNAIIGDSTGVELPVQAHDNTAVQELQRKAKYSRSKEYKLLKEKADERIEFYKRFLPSGQLVGTTSKAELAGRWELANILIAEFEQLFGEYENAEALLKEEFGDKVLSS